MKPAPLMLTLLAFGLAGGTAAFAQSNKEPGPTDYGSFSRFITDRNIFDPTRQPHYSSGNRPRTRVHTHISVSAPSFAFVGAMNYSKGLFAFFSGNSAEYKKILVNQQDIAGYTVSDISLTSVTLDSADKKEHLELKVGDVMRQVDNKWVLTGPGEITGSADTSGSSTSLSAGSSPAASSSSTSSTPAASGPTSDILQRLKQLREKENQ